MKKILIIILIMLLLTITGCKKRENIYTNDATCEGYNDKFAYILGEDGWVHTMEISYACNNTITYYYDAFNIKYKEMDGYSIDKVYSDGTIVKEKPAFVCYTNNDEYIEELYKIDDYFNEKQYTSTITKKDLEALELKKLNPNIISEVYNKAINSELKTTFGPLAQYSFFKIEQIEFPDYTIRLAMLIPYGYVEVANIEIIYHNDTYLSDLVNNNKATKTQKETYDNILKITEKIKQQNSLNIRNEFPKLNNSFYNNLFDFMENFYK